MRLYEDDPNIPLNWPILYIGCKDWGKKKCNWKGGGCNHRDMVYCIIGEVVVVIMKLTWFECPLLSLIIFYF